MKMNFSAIIIAVAVVGGVGLFLGIFLGIASIVFKVDVDEREEAVLGVLPGNNCGGRCGCRQADETDPADRIACECLISSIFRMDLSRSEGAAWQLV